MMPLPYFKSVWSTQAPLHPQGGAWTNTWFYLKGRCLVMVFALTRDKQQKVSQIRQMGTSNRPLYRSVHSELFQISAPTQIEGDLKHFDVSM